MLVANQMHEQIKRLMYIYDYIIKKESYNLLHLSKSSILLFKKLHIWDVNGYIVVKI